MGLTIRTPCGALLLALVLSVTVTGCGKKHHTRTVGWLKVTIETAYKGQPVHIVGYSKCTGTYVPGGSFGATPGTGTIVMRTQSHGRQMPDGSFISFRAPVLCGEYFGKGPNAANWPLEPTDFIPLMVWADRERRPSIMEAYVSEEAYAGRFSKLAPPRAVVEPLTSVSPEIEESTRSQRNVILQDSGLLSGENEVGYRPGERGFKGAFGWPKAEGVYSSAFECQTLIRSGMLVPGRSVRHRNKYEQCRHWLASLIPFTWDGQQFHADPSRAGMIIFQRVSRPMHTAPYYFGEELVKWPGPQSQQASNSYDITDVMAPVRDPDIGVGELQ